MLFLEVLNMTTLKLKQTIPKPRSLIRLLFLTTGQIIALRVCTRNRCSILESQRNVLKRLKKKSTIGD